MAFDSLKKRLVIPILSLSLAIPASAYAWWGQDLKKVHNISGYTPRLLDVQGTIKPYLKNELSREIEINGTKVNIHIPAFYDDEANCSSCHKSEDELIHKVSDKVKAGDDLIARIYKQEKGKSIPKDIILNPGALAEITGKDKELVEEYIKKHPEEYTERMLALSKLFYESKKVHAGGQAKVYLDAFVGSLIKVEQLSHTFNHELVHIAQKKTKSRYYPKGLEFNTDMPRVSEPFAHYIEALKNNTKKLLEFSYLKAEDIAEDTDLEGESKEKAKKIDLQKTPYTQTEFVYDLINTFIGKIPDITYSELQHGWPAKWKVNQFKKIADEITPLNDTIGDSYNFYMNNRLLLEVLALETRSHEIPLELYAALHLKPIDQMEEGMLKRGIDLAEKVWEEKKTPLSSFKNPALVNELSNSYLAGGVGVGEYLMANVDDMKHLIKTELRDKGFDRDEANLVYFTLLKQKFSDEGGNFRYEPEKEKINALINKLKNEVWGAFQEKLIDNAEEGKEGLQKRLGKFDEKAKEETILKHDLRCKDIWMALKDAEFKFLK